MQHRRQTYRRIVSLTPSITETLFALGLGDRVIGVTDTCDYPVEASAKPHVTSWFDPDPERIRALGPDLILGLESVHQRLKPVLEQTVPGVEVILTMPTSVNEALEAIRTFGKLFHATDEAERLLAGLRQRLERVDAAVGRLPWTERLTVSRVLEWKGEELLVAGPHSFQYDVILRAGGRTVTSGISEAYPRVSMSRFLEWDPDVVFFCGYDRRFIPRLKEHPRWKQFKAVATNRVFMFDCNLTCRTGPRIVDMVELLYHTLYADGS
ncbi:MAG: ABC transporter substrate-binding protein [Deltaproteobacteria bacterium]|nr:ABC transporter substrate-binding protein [Deltaproteobacteria bacterium]